jgi:pyrimidine operon attenuation protein/uracil phosphoribosyltransferase
MEPVTILNKKSFDLTIKRLCFQLIENHDDFKESVIIGLQPRGVLLANRIKRELEAILNTSGIPVGKLDVTFFRDDFRRRADVIIPNSTQIDFIIEGKKVILIDDVLYTGRTIRSGLDAMLAFGRPKKVELLVLIDRRFSRDLPVQANYVGKTVDSIVSDKVKVEWDEVEGEDKVILFNQTVSKDDPIKC